MSERVQFSQALPDAMKQLVELHYSVERTATAEGLDPAVVELVKIRASQLNGCAFCTDMHAKTAIKKGETARRLTLLPVWRETELCSDQKRAALALTEAMPELPGTREVPDEVYQQAAAVFTESQLTALVWIAALIQTFNRLAVTARKSLPSAGW